MARNRWTLSYIVLVLSSIVLLVLYPAIPTFAASSSLNGGNASHRLNHPDTFTTTYGTATISPTSLTGLNQTLNITIPIEVATDDSSNWQMQIGLTPMVSASHTLPTSLNVGLIGTCNSSGFGGCNWIVNNSGGCLFFNSGDVSSAYNSATSIIASGSTPSMITVYSDNEECTYGDITFTTSLTASLLAKDTYSGTYTDEIEANVISGP